MLTLETTTDTIKVVLNYAHVTSAPQCVSSWRDKTATTYTPGRSIINTNGTTPVSAVSAPAASTQRVIDTVTVYNNDTIAHTATINYDANGTVYPLFKAVIGPGASLVYAHASGWKIVLPQGASSSVTTGLTIATPTVGVWSTIVLDENPTPNDSIVANQLMPLNGLGVPVKAGQRYYIRWLIFFTSAASTTGSRWETVGPFFETLMWRQFSSQTTSTRDNNNLAVGQSYRGATGATSGSVVAPALNQASIDMFIHASADGYVVPHYASEVASSAISPKKGSFVEYMAV
jgi:hypothetical protein